MSFEVLKWLYKKSGYISLMLLVSILLNAFLSVIGVRFALLSKDLIDVVTGQTDGSLKAAFSKIVFFLVVQILILIFGRLFDVRIRGRLEIRIKNDLFNTLLKKDWLTLSKYHTGELTSRLVSDVNIIVNGILDIVPTFVSLCVTILMSAYYLFKLAPSFAWFALPVGPVVFVLGRIYSKKIKGLHKKCREADGKTLSFMQELLRNVIAVKAFGSENAVSSEAEGLQLAAYGYKLKRNAVSTFAGVGVYIIFTVGYYSALGWGALKIMDGAITYGSLIAILRLVSQIQTPFRNMSSLLSKTYSTFASAERVIELEALPEEKPGVDYSGLYDKIDSVRVDGLSYSYSAAPLIKNSDLVIKKGEFVAITGISGIGKSTLLKLLLGLISPDEGNIYFALDGMENLPVGADTRSYFSYVPQENMILSGTIKDNIAFFKKDVSEKDILRCAKIACVDEFAEELEKGYDTVLGEGGCGLSGGQIQRIAIARALLCDTPMLLLDEATSALDEETEHRILNNIKALTDKSCIIVSHKNAALDICDKIVKIENHRFVCEEK